MESPPRNTFASVVVRLAGTWVLAGALAKLFLGTPKDLPEIVRNLTPFGLDLTFHLVIGVELAIVSLAWIVPALAWPVLLALFLFFDGILVSQLLAGAESCGCFGSSIKVDPRVMLAVDSALLLALFASKPWRVRGRAGAALGVLAAAVVVSFAVPWFAIPSQDPGEPGPSVAAVSGASSATPASTPRYVVLEPDHWVSKPIHEIEDLTRWVEAEKLPTDGKVVFWRQGCTHCAAHLRELAGRDDGTQPILLLQIRDDLKDSRAVDLMPDGPNVTRAEMPENLQFVLETPWELRVEGGVVTAALDREHAEAAYGKGG